MSDGDTIREALGAYASALRSGEPESERMVAALGAAFIALDRLVAGSAPDPRDAVVEAAQNFMDDVGALDSEDLRLHDLQQRIGAIWLGYGGGFNHEDDLRAALTDLERAALGSPVEPAAQQDDLRLLLAAYYGDVPSETLELAEAAARLRAALPVVPSAASTEGADAPVGVDPYEYRESDS